MHASLCVLWFRCWTFIIVVIIIIIIIIYPLTARVVGAPPMISQPVSSIFFPCSPLPSGTWLTPGLSMPSCCLPTSSYVCFVFFTLSLCLARRFWPDLKSGKHDHTTAVCVSLGSSGLRVVRLPAGSLHGSSSSPAKPSMSSAKRKLVIVLPPMLTMPS